MKNGQTGLCIQRERAYECLLRTCVFVGCTAAFHMVLGCVTTGLCTDERVVQRTQSIHNRLGYTGPELWKEIAHSQGYSRDQAVDLKGRIGKLVSAYEQLFVEADCKRREFPACKELMTAGLRFNSTILDAEHHDLPPLPPLPEGYR
ncbi:MAG: hypothetical protein R3B95_04050 [Nitrospirales bacterium]|nr:hypothetical protein [Nitrospira sp.]MDR4482410.1 hypothetical protein [Nitrospirales bacterium]